ncbi:MAG TPA: hypothetical protein GX505_07495 [Clostridiales bacterium]|nr:hypothetical protein [Clostridiales bacterium]
MPTLWIEEFTATLRPYFLGISLGFLSFLWVVLYIRYNVGLLIPVLGELKQFADFLSELRNMDEANENKITEYIEHTRDNSFLRPVWYDYIENRSADPDLNQYFNNTTLADVPAKRNKAASIPAFLVTIGLAASFFCLVIHLAGLKPGESMPDIFYSVISQIAVIAVFSIIISYLFNSLNARLFDKAESRVYEINKLLKRKLPRDQDENYIERIATSVDNMTSSLSSYAQYTADMQRSGMNQLVDIFLESLTNRMNDQLTALGDSFRNFTAFQIKSAAQAEELASELARAGENQRQINTASEAIISSIAQYHEQISNCSRSLSDSLKDLQSLSETLSGIVSFNSKALEDVQKERESLREEYSTYVQGIYDLIRQYKNDTAEELGRTLTKLSDVTEKAYNQLKESVARSMEEWAGNSKNIMQSIEEHNRNLHIASSEIAQHLNELNASLRACIQEFTEAVEKGTVQTISQFDEGLSEVTLRLSNTIAEIRDSIDDLPVVIDSLKRHLE